MIEDNYYELVDNEKRNNRKGIGNYILLLQGQFVSCCGDVIYQLALGFWVLSVTGSTGIMGIVVAATTVPKILIAPIAGVIIDKRDRKKIMILMDFIRGFTICLIAILAIWGILKIWMIFFLAIILGVCGSFFSPTVNSVVPDLVDKKNVVQANSSLSATTALANVIANPLGGMLYQALKAPILFLMNGISYIFSGICICFIKIPKVKMESDANKKEVNKYSELKQDFIQGLRYIWDIKGLRNIMISSAIVNFFGNIVIVLILPYFQKSEELGATKYGGAVSAFTIGLVVGMITLSVFKIKSKDRYKLFVLSAAIYTGGFIIAFSVRYELMIPILFIVGMFNSMSNILTNSVLQLTVPQNMRGKVFSLFSTATTSLIPIAVVVGGIAGEFISIKKIIIFCSITMTAILLPSILNKECRDYINYDIEK